MMSMYTCIVILPHTYDIEGADQIMVGITSWINRVAIPFEYDWKIPRFPVWLHEYE